MFSRWVCGEGAWSNWGSCKWAWKVTMTTLWVASAKGCHTENLSGDFGWYLPRYIQREGRAGGKNVKLTAPEGQTAVYTCCFWLVGASFPAFVHFLASRGLYEEDLLGLNISLSSVDQQKLDSPKPQKTSDTKKVWQRGGVTIPLSSQEKQAQLSAAAKNILDQLEDLAFMNSPVLMFPLKPE